MSVQMENDENRCEEAGSQVRATIQGLQKAVMEGESSPNQGKQSLIQSPSRKEDGRAEMNYLQEMTSLTGPACAEVWRPRSDTPATTIPAVEESGPLAIQLMTYMRSMAVMDPGVFRGNRNENFKEFVRRFKRKYESVIRCEATLLEIMADDHLAGRAKSIYKALPREIKERGFEVVITEMSKLLSSDSTAGRMRALTELRNLCIRPNQDVAEFCLILERLGQEANPESSIEDRSMEYAQILLDNLKGWPEHFQLVGALHRVEPRQAYSEVKQLALSIEQSKLMFKDSRRPGGSNWKNRAREYGNFSGGREGSHYQANQLGPIGREGAAVEKGNISRTDPAVGHVQDSVRTGRSPYQGNKNESRKCYNCTKYGHISRECPQRSARVNNIELGKELLSDIVKRARSLGMAVRDKERGATELVGDRMTATLNLLGGESPALRDTGSMISIIPVETLAKVQDRGVDVDALQFRQKSELRPVFDASNNLMHFLGAVYIEVKLRGGKSSKVAFHISPGKEEEIILGTNALRKLGVEVSITDGDNNRETYKERKKDNVVVVGRIYIPPNQAAVVHAKCEAESAEISERVIWPSREGISAGVYRIQNQLTQIPVFNSSHQPMLLKDGESIGHWGTDKWFERWEDLNPLMPSEENEIGEEERMQKLCELIEENMDSTHWTTALGDC